MPLSLIVVTVFYLEGRKFLIQMISWFFSGLASHHDDFAVLVYFNSANIEAGGSNSRDGGCHITLAEGRRATRHHAYLSMRKMGADCHPVGSSAREQDGRVSTAATYLKKASIQNHSIVTSIT